MARPKGDRDRAVMVRVSATELEMIKKIGEVLETDSVSGTLRKLVVKAAKGAETGWLKELMK